MTTYLFTNNASATLASSITNVATTLTVSSGQGSLFPVPTGGAVFMATLTNAALQEEIIKVTARAVDTFTIQRGQEGTTARNWAAGDLVELRVTAASLNEWAGAIAAVEAALPGKAALSHTHAIADVTGLTTALAGKVAKSGDTLTGALFGAKGAMGANNIDLTLGSVFAKTISGATTLTVSNVPATGTVASFMLDLTNGGSAVITWWAGIKWPGGWVPTLTASGRDVLGFVTHDGGTTWTGLLLGRDVR